MDQLLKCLPNKQEDLREAGRERGREGREGGRK